MKKHSKIKLLPMILNIDSIKDPRIIHARTLATAQGRLENGEFLLEGMEQIIWGIEAHLDIHHVFVSDKLNDTEKIITQLSLMNVPCFAISEGILKKITDTHYVVPYVAVAKKRMVEICNNAEMVIVLDNLVDHGNIGTIIRSAAAFGIKDIIGTNINVDFFYKKIIDASRGKIFDTHIKKREFD